jgi:hypothetical protein
MFFQEWARLLSPGQRHHRDAGVERLDQGRDEIGRAGSERAVADARPVGHPRIGVGGEGAAALVVDEMVDEAERAQRVVERQELEPAHAEHRTDAMQAQHFCERPPAIHLSRGKVAQGTNVGRLGRLVGRRARHLWSFPPLVDLR